MISSPSAGGAEVLIKDLARELVSGGLDIHIGFIERAEDIGRSVEYQKQFLRELDDAGVKYFFVGHASRWFPLLGAMRVRAYIQSNKIEIYHSHLTYGILFGALTAVRRVYTHHSVKMRVPKVAFRFLTGFLDQLVGISAVCSDALSEYSERDVETIFNGVDPNRIERARPSSRHRGASVRCVCVGRICQQKNFELLVNSIALLQPANLAQISVEIAGEGSIEDTSRLESNIADAGLNAKIQLLGNVQDVPKLLARCDLFLMTSAVEGLPIVLIEAAMSGLPCVTTDAGGCREIVETCENGIVVELDNPQEFAEAIEEIIDNSQEFTRYSNNALENSKEFSIANTASAHIELYERLLPKRGCGRKITHR